MTGNSNKLLQPPSRSTSNHNSNNILISNVKSAIQTIQYCFNILLELQGLSPPHYITLLGAHIELRALSHTQPHHNFQASYMEFKIKMEPMFITLCCLGSRSIITYIGVYRGYGYPLTPLFMNAIIAFIVVISLYLINGGGK
jgi:hypothetical protein